MTRAEREAYKAWLESLKKGDEVGVAYVGSPLGARIETVTFVGMESLTVTGDVNKLGMRFRMDNGRICDRRFHGARMLVVPTDDMRKKCTADDARNRLRWKVEWHRLSDAKALRIAAILDEPEGQEAGK